MNQYFHQQDIITQPQTEESSQQQQQESIQQQYPLNINRPQQQQQQQSINTNNIQNRQQQQQQQAVNDQIINMNQDLLISVEKDAQCFLEETLYAEMSYLIQIMIFYLCLYYQISLAILFTISGLITLYTVAWNLRGFKDYSVINTTGKKRQQYILFENLMLLIFKLFLCLYLIQKYIHTLGYALVFFLIYTGLRCLMYFFQRTPGEYCQLNDFINILVRIFCCFQLFTLTIKIEYSIQWQWREVFWSYWIFLAIIIGMSFGTFLMLISKICHMLTEMASSFEIAGIFWFFFLQSGYAGGTYLIVLGFIEILEEGKQNILKESLQQNVIIFSAEILYTLLLKKQIQLFLVRLIVSDTQSNSSMRFESFMQQPQTVQQIYTNNTHQNKPISVPHFVYKYSSTYFKTVANDLKKHFKPKFKQTPQKKCNKQNTQKVQFLSRSFSDINSNQKFFRESNQQSNFTKVKASIAQNPSHINNHKFLTTEAPLNQQYILSEQDQQTDDDFQSKTDRLNLNKDIKTINQKNRIMYNNPLQKIKQQDFKGKGGSVSNQLYNDNYELNSIPELQTQKRTQSQISFPIKLSHSLINEAEGQSFQGSSFMKSVESSKINKSSNQCLICYDNAPDAVLMDCGHGGLCYQCSIEIWQNTEECYLCRQKIKQVLQIDLTYYDKNTYKVKAATQLVSENEENLYDVGQGNVSNELQNDENTGRFQN